MDLTDFRVEPSSLNEPTTIDWGQDSSIDVLPFKNKGFINYFSRLQKPHQKLIDEDKAPAELTRSILSRAMAEKLITGWKNVRLPIEVLREDFPTLVKKIKGADSLKDGDKVEIPYSKENVFTVLNHEAYDEFRGWILIQSRTASNFVESADEEDEGN